MSITVEAIYENGVLKPTTPLALPEHEKVRITIEPQTTWTERGAGIVRWTGDPQTLEHFAIDPAFDPQESS